VNRLYGLIGNPLGHSWSKQFFDRKFRVEAISDAEYRLFQLAAVHEITELVNSTPLLCGLNVTIPYKTKVIPLLDKLDPVAREVNAVNTIKIIRDTNRITMHGYNTDVYGFEESIKPMLQQHHKAAMILGTGGAARAAAWVLKKMEMDFIFVSRKPQNSSQIHYDSINMNLLEKFPVIVNATPVGMFPDTDGLPPLPYEHINPRHLLFDMVYNPAETLFLARGLQQKASVRNGLEMLQLQAEKAWEIWISA